jgi:hypothetical protein
VVGDRLPRSIAPELVVPGHQEEDTMVTPHAMEDVRFDAGVATELAAAFRSTATLLDHQGAERSRVAGEARTQWRGRYRDQFDQRLHTCVGSGQMLADKLRLAGRMLDNAVEDVAAEQARRDRAQEEDRSWGEKLVDFIDPRD